MIIVCCILTTIVSLWYVYATYLEWEEDFAKKRVNQRSKKSPSNKDTPDPKNYESHLNSIQDFAQKYPKSFKSSVRLDPLKAREVRSATIKNRSQRFPSFQNKPKGIGRQLHEVRSSSLHHIMNNVLQTLEALINLKLRNWIWTIYTFHSQHFYGHLFLFV